MFLLVYNEHPHVTVCYRGSVLQMMDQYNFCSFYDVEHFVFSIQHALFIPRIKSFACFGSVIIHVRPIWISYTKNTFFH